MINNMSNNANIIGVGGFARSGKDTFVKVASKILNQNGYTTSVESFAAGLKDDLDPWLKNVYNISAWTNNDEEKKLIRPFMVAHGCGKRTQTEGKYWVDKVDHQIKIKIGQLALTTQPVNKHVFFISDVRFENEAKWLHESWNGWLVHLKKYKVRRWHPTISEKTMACYTNDEVNMLFNPLENKEFDEAPNEEEAKQDPFVIKRANYELELENVIEREKRNGNIITVESVDSNSYLIEEITKCLTNCPFLTLPKQ